MGCSTAPADDILDIDSDDDGVDDSVETAQDYNSSRSNKPSTIADIGDLDSDGFPDVLKSASFSISKRSARTGRNERSIHEGDTNTQTSPLYESKDELANNGGDLNGDGYSDTDGFHFEMDFNDPDDDGITDLIQNSSFSISKRSARQ